jgi:predicted amidohydrolase
MVWLSADCETPSLAAAFVKLRSRPTTTRARRSYKVPRWHNAVVGMMICNDRRWPAAWRVLSLQAVEIVLLGYNSAAYDPNSGASESAELRTFHSRLVVQANAYMNAAWAVAVAKAGNEDGAGLIGGSCIVDPGGQVVAEAQSLEDEVIVAECDLDRCLQGETKMFDFAAHRRPAWYGPITDRREQFHRRRCR